MRSDREIIVLHVDDEPDLCEVVAAFLERAADDLTVQSVASVEAAMEVLANEQIDCVVSDYDMPDRDGLEFLRAVRAEYPSLPFVLFTGKGSEEIASEAISAGVDDYLQKERGTDQYQVLANRIRNLVEGYRARAAAERHDERYHNLIDTAPIPISLFGEDRSLVYANDATVDFLDADSRADLVGVGMPTLLHPDDRDQALTRFQRVIEEGIAVGTTEFRIRSLSGTWKTAIVATAPGEYRGQRVAQAIVRETREES